MFTTKAAGDSQDYAGPFEEWNIMKNCARTGYGACKNARATGGELE